MRWNNIIFYNNDCPYCSSNMYINSSNYIGSNFNNNKKKSSCSQRKIHDYIIKLDIVSASYKELSSMISVSLDDAVVSDDEFSRIIKLYDVTMSKLELDNNNNNGANVTGTTSTTS